MTGPIRVPSPRGYPAATLHLTVDPTEHARRQQAGLGHITDSHCALLDTLMVLPADDPVPVDDLTERQQRDVRRAPAGILDLTPDLVTRHAIRPCRVDLATVHATCTRASIGRASSYAPICSRAIVTPTPPRRDYLLYEADFWGIGVLLDHGNGERETLVAPRPWRPKRHTPAAWRFAELAYASYLSHTPTPETTTTSNRAGEEARG
ncbi:hypothetical protein E4N62_25015 [Streptomyces sp. MNU76]|uniref:hypothetical protein n=1 Tax=Streptomyces sp. MNU76 TaxID=2560026 RepID=UPI001E2CE590|nr:hypothetical protein [Streptomyces sp. MNU76]MCC9708233.1 hypothetical protein [Streptomyces sp. MNU76]